MAVTRKEQRYTVKVTYNKEYDTTGELELENYSQTFTKVKEGASAEELKAFADALMSLTVYANAPYRVQLIDTSILSAS